MKPAGALTVAFLVSSCGDVTADLVKAPVRDAAVASTAGTGGSPSMGGTSGAGGTGATPGPNAGVDGGTECVDNADCAGNRLRDLCDTLRGRCVQCVTDGHCDTSTERCSVSLGECATPCTDVSACDPDEVCDTVIGFCVECVTDDDCPLPGQLCRASICTM